MSPIKSKSIESREYSFKSIRNQDPTVHDNLKNIAQSIPGYVHFNSLDDLSLICANKNFEDYFGLSTGEIVAKGKLFIREHYCPKTWNNSLRQILKQEWRNSEHKVFGHVQKIRKNPTLPYRDFICSTRVLSDLKCLITDYVPADFFGIESRALNAISDCIDFTKNNHNKYSSLSTREREIIHLIAFGKSRREISDMLYISKHTLDNHRKHIRQKLGVKSTAELFHFINTFDIFS
ncbi:MAG: helix-turn-helix transcriptional regulator [Bacteroidales bacterium]|jgi:DNA-binding CsgD family transcriptional regulator|nr:helix-turn-helix transcriptional regulator [Bacteroidales bacterium]